MCLVVFSSCNDFNRLVKSTDNEMKYEVAVDYFERGDYNHALWNRRGGGRRTSFKQCFIFRFEFKHKFERCIHQQHSLLKR